MGPEIHLDLVEYQITNFHLYHCIHNRQSHYFCRLCYLLFVQLVIVKIFFIIIHFWNTGKIKYYDVRSIFIFKPYGMFSRVASAFNCLIVLGVIGILVKFLTF